MNTSGKTATIFLVLIVVILGSVSSISLFLLNKEKEMHKTTQVSLKDIRDEESKLQVRLKESEKQIYILQENNKEADERINNLMDDLELAEGVRDEIKGENAKLKEALEAEAKAKADLRKKMAEELEMLQKKAKEDATRLEAMEKAFEQLKQEKEALQKKASDLEKIKAEQDVKLKAAQEAKVQSPVSQDQIELDKIVVTPEQPIKGRVLSVDSDTEFLIFDLGVAEGIQQGAVLSVYRADQYLGDVLVTRVQDDMSAADFIPPFSSRKARKNDTVILKP